MKRTISCLAFVVVACAIGSAQVVQVQPHDGTTDAWGKYFNARKKITFSGLVTGIAIAKQAPGGEDQVVALVRNKVGGGTADVELGPKWYVNEQQAKIHVGDEVQVTGSKVLVDGHGTIIASQVVVNGQGGPVLALRRLSGRAYWMTSDNTRVASRARNTANGDAESEQTDQNLLPPAVQNNPNSVITSNDGLVNIDTNGYWNLPYNLTFPVNTYTNVVTGPYPITFGPMSGFHGFYNPWW